MTEPLLPPEAALDLTRAILARTSGSPCGRLRELACDFVDGSLDPAQSQLAQAHLDGCADCSGLMAALRATQTVLPALAQADPGPWFAQRVLRATAGHPAPSEADPRPLWWRLMHRPRIALEAAYLGAAAGLLGSYLPIPAPSIFLQVPAFVQPLSASAQRVKARVVQAERRGTAAIQQGLRPNHQDLRSGPAAPAESRTLWQRGSSWARARLQVFRRPPPPPAQENGTGPANP